jgi:hypothetical protein
LRRYTALFRVQLAISALTAMQYRTDFVVRGLIAILWMAVTLAPVLVVFGVRRTVAGWSFPESMVVVGWFTLLHAVLEGAVSPSLTAVVEHVRHGTLDFFLLKPADAQFLVSTAKIEPWHVVDVFGALAIFGYAFTKLGRWPPRFSRLGGGHPLFVLDPGGERVLLGGEGRQSLLPLRISVRRRPLAHHRLPGRAPDRLHLRLPDRASDHLPGHGAARPAGR